MTSIKLARSESPTGPVVYSVDAFCRAYGISRTLAYAELSSGRLRSVKVGQRRLIHIASAKNWFENLSANA